MAVLHFDKNELGNLEYSLQREMLSTNRAGGYMSTTIVCCNTRKYHGLMVCPKDDRDENNYVLLSSVDETVVQHEQSFNLAIHRFPGVYDPRGHKYITDFTYTPAPAITYRVGGVILKKELLWIHSRTQLLIRYTLLDARSQTQLRLRPFLAFRDRHTVGRANMEADGRSYPIEGGVRNRLYEGFPWLHMQIDAPSEFVAAPDWYYNFEYGEEIARGYPGHEDLLTTGYFELDIAKGQSVIFSCSTEPVDPSTLDQVFEEELSRRSNKIDFLSCLRHSARQFIVRNGDRTEVVAGYPWFGRWGRDTFIALPGITLTQGDDRSCREVLDTMVSQMQGGLFPNMGNAYNSVDAPLWFFWTLQAYEPFAGGPRKLWKKYGSPMKAILEAYRDGANPYVRVDDNALVWAAHPRYAMTWMDAVVDGKPVTGREGYQVEVNALWYNAVRYALELARKSKDTAFRTVGTDARTNQEVVPRTVLVRARRVFGRLCRRTRTKHVHPSQPDHRLLAALRHARRGHEAQRDRHGPPPPADPQGAPHALAPQSALRRTLRRRPADPRPGLPSGNRMAVAAGTLRESLLRHAREGISPRSKGHAEEFRGGYQRERYRVDQRDLRRRSSA